MKTQIRTMIVILVIIFVLMSFDCDASKKKRKMQKKKKKEQWKHKAKVAPKTQIIQIEESSSEDRDEEENETSDAEDGANEETEDAVWSTKFDHLMLVMSWAPSAAAKCAKSDVIREKITAEWTIHGLWPQANDKQTRDDMFSVRVDYDAMIEKDGKNEPLNEKQEAIKREMVAHNFGLIAKQVADIEEKWPTVFKKKTAQAFWEREWYTHGKFSKNGVAHISTPLAYLMETMRLAGELDIAKWLAEDPSILPSDTQRVSMGDVQTKVQKHFKFPVILSVENIFGHDLLVEIKFCYNLDLKPMACSGAEPLALDMALYPIDYRLFKMYWIMYEWYPSVSPETNQGFDIWRSVGLRCTFDELKMKGLLDKHRLGQGARGENMGDIKGKWVADIDAESTRRRPTQIIITLYEYWNTHGIVFMALNMADITGYTQYFEKSIKITKKIKPNAMFEHVTRNNPYTRNTMMADIARSVTEVNPASWTREIMLRCVTIENRQYLGYIAFCFNLQKQEVDCRPEDSNCDGEFTLPAVSPRAPPATPVPPDTPTPPAPNEA